MFAKAVKNVKNARANYGVPDEFKFMQKIDGKDVTEPFTIIKCIEKVYHTYDKEAMHYRYDSNENPIYGYVTFIQIEEDVFIAVKSTPLKEQLENITGMVFDKTGFYEVPIANTRAKLSSIKVQYADKKFYDNWVLDDE